MRGIRPLTIKALIVGSLLLYIVRLYFDGAIGLYIHPRYSLFSVVMAGFGVTLLVVGYGFRRRNKHSASTFRFRTADSLLMVVLVLALLVPPRTLSPQAIGRKSLTTPSSLVSTTSQDRATECPTLYASTIELLIYQIGRHPVDCFQGEPIKLSGFVMPDEQNVLPDSLFYLARIVISCCVIDSRPFAIPVKSDGFRARTDFEWLNVEGRLEVIRVGETYQVVVAPHTLEVADPPKAQYEYIMSR